VLNQVVARGVTVLPFAFGIIVPDEQAVIRRVLAPQQARLVEALERLHDHVELTVRAQYRENRVLAEVVAEQPALASSSASRASGARKRTYQSKIDQGRRIAAAIQAKRQRDGKRLLAAMSPLAREVRVKTSTSDLTVLSGSFLVHRRSLDRFDRALEEITAAEQTRLQLDCVGPLPPYSFTEIRI